MLGRQKVDTQGFVPDEKPQVVSCNVDSTVIVCIHSQGSVDMTHRSRTVETDQTLYNYARHHCVYTFS